MIPIRATLNYKESVPTDPENPDHSEYFGLPMAEEKRQSSGFITDILSLDDVIPANQTASAYTHKTGVYVIFWMDMGDYYRLTVQNYSDMTTTSTIMQNYINANRV